MANPADVVLYNSHSLDLSSRIVQTITVAGSPATNEEKVIATLLLGTNSAIISGIQVFGWAAFTVGTSGVTATMRIRQASVTGAVVVSSGATTVVAASLIETGVQGFDTAAALPNQTYVLTLQIGSGAAISTVSVLQLLAIIV